MNTYPTSRPLTTSSHRRCRRSPARSDAPNNVPEPEREQVAEVHAALDHEQRRDRQDRCRHECERVVAGDLACECVRADDREHGAERERARGGAEQHVGDEQDDRPAERVLREERAVADAAQPRLEEERVATARHEDLPGAQALDLPEVHRFVAVPRVRGEHLGVDDDRDDGRDQDDQRERPVPPDEHRRARWFRNARDPCGSSRRTAR